MRSILLLGASLAAVAAMPAFAQEATAETDATAESEYIIVTGSRIARPNLESPVPITTITAQELTQTGEVNLGDTINLLPQFRPTFSSQNSGRFIGTAGINALDLRGQGTARTLVLQNSRRHVSSQPGQQTVDVNTIPTELVERIDVVTGGNSALYGSDAVAGVVNFIMKRDFEGLEIRGQSGVSSRFDRGNYYLSVTAGTNFADGRGNIAGNVGISSSPPLFFADRDGQTGAFSGRRQFQLTENTAFSGPGNGPEPAAGNGVFDTTLTSGVKNAGISTGGAYTSACPANTPANAARRAVNCSGVLVPSSRDAMGNIIFSEAGNIFNFGPGGVLQRNVGTQDFRPFGSGNFQGGTGSTLRETGILQVGQTNYSGNLLGSYEFSTAARFFFEGKFVRTESIQEGQPTFSSGALNPTFSINNPFLSSEARSLLVQSLAPGATGFTISRFNTDFGGRGENHTRDLYRIVAGIDGTFLDTWRYEVALNYGHVDTFYQTRGNVNLANFTRAVNAVTNTSGQIVCAVNADANATNDDPACRPLNLFGIGSPSAEALDYIIYDSSRKQWAEQFNAIAYVAGDLSKLFELPGGAIGFVLGGEYRQENSFSAFDDFTAGGGTFLNAISAFEPPKLEVWDGFGEIRIPILADMPFFEELTVEGAARVTNYNVGNTGTVWAFNVGGTWSPIRDLRIRASYAKAVRAPTQSDLFSSSAQTFLNGLVDPCGQQNINANPNRVANCAAAGVPTTQTFGGITEPFTNRPASGILGTSGGNPELSEERSTSWTLGAIIQPRFAPGLTFSVDYYNIDINSVIVTLAAQTIINQCYDSVDGIDNQFCAAVTRNPNGTFAGQQNVLHAGSQFDFAATGSSFLQGPFNFARQSTEGIDFDLAYTYPSDGDWRASGRAIVSWLKSRDEFTSITEPDRRTRLKGRLGDPEWNARLNVVVGYKALDLGWTMRFIDKQTVAVNYRTQLPEQDRPPENADNFPEIWYPTYTYHDLRLDAAIGQHKLYVGVDNVLDALPPYDLLGTEAGAPYTNTGRFFYVGAQLKF